ncbi:MAG: hypothetical protein ACOX8S_12890 [Christensenellales bacterium]|jgi:hypothetical protein
MMQIIEKNEGPKIAHEENGTMVFLGDYELMLNVAKYQRDWPVHIDICSNRDNQLVVGTGEGLYYVAQFDILATKYTEPVTEEEAPEPIPIDMSEVVLTLWSLDNPIPAEI